MSRPYLTTGRLTSLVPYSVLGAGPGQESKPSSFSMLIIAESRWHTGSPAAGQSSTGLMGQKLTADPVEDIHCRIKMAHRMSKQLDLPTPPTWGGRRPGAVLLNFRKHLRAPPGVDPCSSGPWFDGWARSLPSPVGPSPVAPSRTWLGAVGWRRAGGPIDFRDAPDPRPHISR